MLIPVIPLARHQRAHGAVALLERQFNRIGKAGTNSLRDHQTIDDDIDCVWRCLAKCGKLLKVTNRTVNSRANVALPQNLGELLLVLSLHVPDSRCQQNNLGLQG